MIKKFFVTFIASVAFLVSCNDDNSIRIDAETKIPIAERNALDDKAINQYLEDYYFSPGDTVNGKVIKSGVLTKFDTIKGNADDKYPSLKSLAKQDAAGFWYAENPYQKGSATGKTIKSIDESKITISYYVQNFRATEKTSLEDNPSQKFYGTLGGYLTSPNPTYNYGDGSAVNDPIFYRYIPTATEEKNGVKREHLELKYFAEGLKHFTSTNRSKQDIYNFQGVIILPSRLAFARNRYFTGTSLSDIQYRDVSFIFNFELVDVEDRPKE
jgi:hypothetical protein